MLVARFWVICLACFVAAPLFAQAPPAPATGEPPPPDAPAPAEPAPSPAPAPPAVAPEEPPPPPPPPADPVPSPQPEGGYDGQVSPTESSPAYEEDFNQGEENQGGGDDAGFPGFSVRLDPFNWLIEGRLGFELEVVVWKFITAELVPVLVANTEPPSFNFSGREDAVSQHSNGFGPFAGTSIGAGFWLSGEPLRGYVLRAVLTNYGFTYQAKNSGGVFDEVDFTERRLMFYFGSHSRWGAFTIAGGLGLGYELNQQQRCFVNVGLASMAAARSGCPDEDEQHILVDPDGGEIADINGGFHPIYIEGRLSLGIAID